MLRWEMNEVMASSEKGGEWQVISGVKSFKSFPCCQV